MLGITLLPRFAFAKNCGSYMPARVMTNAEFEKLVDTSDEWITTRTGIRERRIAAPNEYTSDLAAEAARRAMATANVKPEELELIVVATITPDMPSATSANAFGFDNFLITSVPEMSPPVAVTLSTALLVAFRRFRC